jgi:hypothetical protein
MSENLICPGQRIMTKNGRQNWDRIFSKKKKRPATQDDVILMTKHLAQKWVTRAEVAELKKRGWKEIK